MKNNGATRMMQVRAELLKRGLTLVKAAELAGVSKRMLRYVIEGERRSARVVKALKKAGVPVRLLPGKDTKRAKG